MVNAAFIMNVNNNLDIGSVDMHVYTDEITDKPQLLISYKTIFINVYTINVLDLDNDMDHNGNLIYRHESFCLWETSIVSIMNQITRDLVILSNEGLSVMDLSSNIVTRNVSSNDNQKYCIHSLASCSYLKLDELNHILFKCTAKNRMLCVQSQHKNKNNETIF